MTIRLTPCLLLIALLMTGLESAAQQDEIVSKVITKTIPMTASDQFSIFSEKADIRVTGWENNFSEVRITFSASHRDRSKATAELDYMRYSLAREKNNIELRNAFDLPFNVNRIDSKLSVLIEVKFPVKGQLWLTNKYGTVDLNGLSGEINAAFSFCDVFLRNITASMLLEPTYSEVRGNISSASFTCKSDKSDMNLELKGGKYTFNASLGEIDLEIDGVAALDIKGSRTDIKVRTESVKQYNYDLNARGDKIFIDDVFGDLVRQEHKDTRLLVNVGHSKPSITIHTTYSPITIK